MRMYSRFILPFLLTGIVLTTGCITINPPPAQAPTPAPVPASTPAKPPSIEAFKEYGRPPSMNPLEFVTAREQVDQTFMKLFGEVYYYSYPNLVEYYKPHDITKLRQALQDLAKLAAWNYQKGYFDCSEMSALTEYALKAAGFDTYIVTGVDPTVGTGHAWCIIVMKSPSGVELIPVEATSPGRPQIPDKGVRWAYQYQGNVGYQTYEDYITYGWVLENIYLAYKYLPNEFDWWNSCQVDRSWFKRGIISPAPTPTPAPAPMPTPTPTPTPAPTPTPVKKALLVNFDGWYIGSTIVSVTTKGTAVTAKVSLSYGESGQYALRIRRDIAEEADDTVKQSTFSYDGVSGSKELLFTPPYATGEANTDGYHLDLLKDGYILWTLTDAYPPRLRVTAPVVRYTLNVMVNPAGGGNFSLNPGGGTYNSGTTVTLTATPSSGYQFSSWSGDVSGTSSVIMITMNSNKSVTANFSIIPSPLSVTLDGWYVGGSKVTTAVKGNTVAARIILSGGSPGQYRMRIRRDIAWVEDETVNETTFSYSGTSLTRELSFIPPYATNEASTNGYHVDLVKDGSEIWALPNAYPPRLRVNPTNK